MSRRVCATRTGKLDVKFLEKIDVFVCLSEKEVAALAFPNLEGKLNYVGFKSADGIRSRMGKRAVRALLGESVLANPRPTVCPLNTSPKFYLKL